MRSIPLPDASRSAPRRGYLALALGTIALGLLVQREAAALGSTARNLLGGALWAAMIAGWIGVAAPGLRLRTRAAAALGLCFAVEASQLYHAPALDAFRATTPGHLVLGTGFEPRDFAAYTVGVAAAALLEHALARRRARFATSTASNASLPRP